MNRFREPTARDDVAQCQNCGESFHYEALSDDGFCKQCEPEEKGTMTDENLQALQAKEQELWAELERLDEVAVPIRDKWIKVRTEIARETMRREVMAEAIETINPAQGE